MLAQEQMIINHPQINLGWKLEESPNQQSREVLERFSDQSSSGEKQTAVKMVVDNYMKGFICYACAKKTVAGKRGRSLPVLLALQCLSVLPQGPQGGTLLHNFFSEHPEAAVSSAQGQGIDQGRAILFLALPELRSTQIK